MKHLHLSRHTKSSWKDNSLPDHDRPPTGRGRRAAKTIARHLRKQGIAPELVLCSTARRARETLDRIAPALGARAIRVERDLHAASAPALLERLRSVPDPVGSGIVIGHNRGPMNPLISAIGRRANPGRKVKPMPSATALGPGCTEELRRVRDAPLPDGSRSAGRLGSSTTNRPGAPRSRLVRHSPHNATCAPSTLGGSSTMTGADTA